MSKSRAEPLESGILDRAIVDGVAVARMGLVIVRVSAGESAAVFANSAARNLLGYADDEPLPEALLDLAGATSLSVVEVAALHREGHFVPLHLAPCRISTGGVELVAGFFLDASARRDAELASLASEARFRRLIEGAPDGIAITRAAKLLYVNSAAVRLLGYDRAEELNGQLITSFLDEDGRKRFAERVGSGGPLPPLEYRTRRRDGTWIVAEITSLPFDWEGGPAIIAFARDVTERSRTAEQLKNADRLASLGTLSAGVAHEINNPLTFMTLGVELLGKRLCAAKLDEEERSAMLATLAELRRGAERVAEIVRDLRTFSRADDHVTEPVDVRTVIESSERMVNHRARHFARVSIDLSELPLVRANPSRLEQVFVNLLLNACQAFDEDKEDNRIDIRAGVLPGARVHVDVIDNGPGIPEDVASRIFDPFFTTKSVGEGTGLGLAICHGIVARYGGEMLVESRPGRTCFRVVLPAIHGPSEAPPSTEPSSSGPDRRLRILVVDDEPSIVRVIKRSLGARHEISTAAAADEALRCLEERPFDVILCDLAMPGLSGVDLYHQIRARHPELASGFAVMTGGPVSGKTRAFLQEWTGPRLDKPFSIRKLEHVLAQATGADVGPPPASDPFSGRS